MIDGCVFQRRLRAPGRADEDVIQLQAPGRARDLHVRRAGSVGEDVRSELRGLCKAVEDAGAHRAQV